MAAEAQLVVVGRCSDPRILALDNRACIRVVGEVEDLTPYYNMASVVVVPLRVGGGTRIKIIEAFGWKRSVVATRLAVEGIPATPTRELFVEDNPEQFALRCVDILRDPSMRREMGERARKFADAYEWAKIRRRMMEVVYSGERG
jgi:glycosyltransferase involved in cell wall biosynthesis